MGFGVASLVLQYIDPDKNWIMFAARTNRSLSIHLDNCHHWEERFKQLITELRSGLARFEIGRYVCCQMRTRFIGEREITWMDIASPSLYFYFGGDTLKPFFDRLLSVGLI